VSKIKKKNNTDQNLKNYAHRHTHEDTLTNTQWET